ncbi:MAG: hypothetical protein AAFX03_00745 [Pseudomonadota bacterium]
MRIRSASVPAGAERHRRDGNEAKPKNHLKTASYKDYIEKEIARSRVYRNSDIAAAVHVFGAAENLFENMTLASPIDLLSRRQGGSDSSFCAL